MCRYIERQRNARDYESAPPGAKGVEDSANHPLIVSRFAKDNK